MTINYMGGGSGVDSKKYVPVTRTVNKKPLDKDIVISAKDIEFNFGDNANLDELLKALQLKIDELELAINSGTKPGDLKPIKDEIDKLKQSINELSKKILIPKIQYVGGRNKTVLLNNTVGSVVTFTCQAQRDSNINAISIGKSINCTMVMTGSNQIRNFGFHFVQQNKTEYGEFIVSATVAADGMQLSIEQALYNHDSDGEPTTVAAHVSSCHFYNVTSMFLGSSNAKKTNK